MKLKLNIIIATVFFFSLFFIWPNFVHEPMHWLALKSIGLDGRINLSWKFPATPSTTRTTSGDLPNVVSGLWFLLAPSLLSVLILMICAVTIKFRAVGILTHIALPSYLTFDLVANILGYKSSAISDFAFLQSVPNIMVWILVIFISLGGFLIIWNSLFVVRDNVKMD
jgi:hypothetical protein